MSQELEVILKLLLGLVFLTFLIVIVVKPQFLPGLLHRRIAFGAMALLGVLSYFNFGKFHTDGSFLHNWEQYHYVLNSKYYAELGHDGLYVAGIQAEMERRPDFKPPQRIRDLRSRKIVTLDNVRQHMKEVRERFSGERWRQFVQDSGALRFNEDLWRDHGYNPTPAWTIVGQTVCRWLPWNGFTAKIFALIDILLLGILLAVFFFVFGFEFTCLTLIVFGINYCSRFFWNGGAFIRQDWLVAVGLAICAIYKKKFFLAGLAISYAISVRVFPVLLIFPLFIFVLAELRRRTSVVWALRFGVGCAIGGVTMFGLGCLAGRGWEAWPEAIESLRLHREVIVSLNNVGLEPLFITSWANFTGALTNPDTFYDYTAIRDDAVRMAQERGPLIIGAKILFSAGLIWLAAIQKTPVRAFCVGFLFIYVLAAPRCYYWSILAFIPLLAPDDIDESEKLALLAVLGNVVILLWHPVYYFLVKQGVFIRLSVAGVYFPVTIVVGLLLGTVFYRISRNDGNRV